MSHAGSATVQQHLNDVVAVLQRGITHDVAWEIKNCVRDAPAAKRIGFVFDEGGRHPDPENVHPLRDWPKPETIADILSLTCYASYLRDSSRTSL